MRWASSPPRSSPAIPRPPPGRHYERCIRVLGERLTRLGFESRIKPVLGGDAEPEHPRLWLHASLGEVRSTIYFHGHYDVVPARSRDQFTPRVTDDTIFSRGSTDMKGGLVSMIYAMWALREIGVPLKGRVALQVVPDEETGGALGSHALNARDLLVAEDARRSILRMGGEVSGGSNSNVVPASFTFSVDRRINPEEDFDIENKRLLDAMHSTGAEVEVDIFQEARPAGVPQSDPAAAVLREAIAEVSGEPARFELSPGVLETRFYADRCVLAFAYGPGLLSVAHGPREFVKRRDLEKVAVVYALTAERWVAS